MQVNPAIRQIFFSEKVTFVVGYGLVFCCLLHSTPSPGWSSSVWICTRVRSVLHCSSQRDRKNDPLQHCPHLLFFNPAHSYSFELQRVAEVIRQHNINASSSISSHEIKISKSPFAVVFAFMICWIPFWIIVVLRRFKLVATMPRSVELLCMFLFYLSNAINPFIYAGMNPVFRKEFRNLLCCGRNRREFAISFSSRKEMSTDEV